MKDIVLDYNRVMEEAIGGEHGLAEADLDAMKSRVDTAHALMESWRSSGRLGYLDLPAQRDEATSIRTFAEQRRAGTTDVCVLGIGGSALGVTALKTALCSPFHDLLSAKRRGGPRLMVLDNIDPEEMEIALDILPLETTLFIAISKSGGTAETMAQLLMVRTLLETRLGKTKLRERLLVVTDPTKGALRAFAKKEKLHAFDVPQAVGGRFSVLCPVGLLPAALLGIDPVALLEGAAHMAGRVTSSSLRENPAYVWAAILDLISRHDRSMVVMMPYARRLKDLADWYRQLLAESLGKKVDLDGRVVNTGLTPINALGVTDQHSQVQLYVEGPHDKVVIFLVQQDTPKMPLIPKAPDLEELSYLGGRGLGELRDAELVGTEWALTSARRPNMRIEFPEVTAHTVGQFFMLAEHQVAFSGALLGIDPFDQPGVEAGKIAAFALMGREGYSERGAEIMGASQKTQRRV